MTDGSAGAAAPATPPAAIPTAQLKEMLGALRTLMTEAPRTHALHWLLFQQYQQHPLMWQFTWQEAWLVHAQTALAGLLQLAVEQGRTTPDILMGIAGAIANVFGAEEAASRTWQQFLQTMPSVRQDATVRAFAERMRAEHERFQALSRPAQMISRALMQVLPLPAMG